MSWEYPFIVDLMTGYWGLNVFFSQQMAKQSLNLSSLYHLLWVLTTHHSKVSVKKVYTLGAWKASCVKHNPALCQLTINRKIWQLTRKRLLVKMKACLWNKLWLLSKTEGMSDCYSHNAHVAVSHQNTLKLKL